MMEDVLRLLAETYGTAGKNKQLIESIKVRASALVGIACVCAVCRTSVHC